MAGNKKRDKPYRPKRVMKDAINWAISGSCLLREDTKKDLLLHVDSSLQKLQRGEAKKDDWNTLINALNISLELANVQIGPNLIPAIKAGQEALHEVAIRMMANGRSTCRGAELTAIIEALDMYRIQLRLCTQGEFSRAVQRVKELLRSGATKRVSDTYRMLAEREAA